jgi:hypothetical protein
MAAFLTKPIYDQSTGLVVALIIEPINESIVSIATGYRLDDRGFGVRVPVG